MKENLTVVILTKNEESNIVSVIENVKQVTKNILIVDSGSTDKTVEFAEANGAKVIYRAWDNDFAAQRNFALLHIDTEWVLYLDADERIDKVLVSSIKCKLSPKDYKQYSVVRKVYAFGFKYRYGIFKNDEVLRLFPTDKVKWENKVHERPVCDLPKERLSGYIQHYTCNSYQQWLDKSGKYSTIWANDVYIRGKRVSKFAPIIHSTYAFFRAYFFQLGFLDGWAGFYSSLQHFMYTLNKYLKLLELQNQNDNER